jgi:PPIC-type PPIASE domain
MNMVRIFIIVLFTALIGRTGFGQTTPAASPTETHPAQTPPATLATTPKSQPTPEQLSPGAVVISIHGFCSGANQSKPESCVTNITKEEFDRMIAAMSVNPQALSNPVALRSFAESYVQALALADAAEKDAIDKDPQFIELMRVIRVRTLADLYRKRLQLRYNNPSPEEVEAYYKENMGRFEQLELDRIAIPRTNPKLAKEAQPDFYKKAQRLAAEVYDRAAKGEDPGQLQAAAYKALGLTPPFTTDLGAKRRGSLPPALEQELFALQPGELSKPQAEAAVIAIYKVRSRSTLPLERLRPELVQEIKQKNLDTVIQQVTGQLHTDFNQQYFPPGPASHGVSTLRKP